MRRGETALPSAGSCPPGSGQRGAGCCMRPAAAAPSHPTPSHPEKRRAETSQTPRRAEGEPGCPAARRRPCTPGPPPPCPAAPDLPRGAGVAHGASPRTGPAGHSGNRGGGDGGGRRYPRARQRRGRDWRSRLRSRCGGGGKSPPRPLAAPFPSRSPRRCCPAPLRAEPCGGARGAPRRAPSRGSPVFLGTYRPARRGGDGTGSAAGGTTLD